MREENTREPVLREGKRGEAFAFRAEFGK